MVGDIGTILVTSDGGTNWKSQDAGLLNRLYHIMFVSKTHGWAVGLGGIILTTVDAGANWLPQISGTSNTLQAMVYDDDSTLWVVGSSGRIYKYLNRSFPAPIASDISVTVVEDSINNLVTLPVADVNNDNLNYTIISGPTKGTLSGTAPNLVYTPNANFPSLNVNGTDSFTFKADDGISSSDIAAIAITITFVNDPPVVSNQSLVVLEDAGGKQITLTSTDIENDNLTYHLVSSPTHGMLSGTVPNLVYAPNANFPNANANGTDSFTFKTNDGTSDSYEATISITVTPINDLPVANSRTVMVAEDSSNNAVTLTATDADNDNLAYSIVAQPMYGTLSGVMPNLFYTPNPNYPHANGNGIDSFTFKANDGTGDSNVVSVVIAVTGLWLWMTVETPPTGGRGALESGKDWISLASGGLVTESKVAEFGVSDREIVADKVWTAGMVPPTGNVNEIVTGIETNGK